MLPWTIRKANRDDSKALADCITAVYAKYADRLHNLPPVAEGIAEDIENHLVWVATLNQRIVGGLVLIACRDHVKLANVAVLPEAAGLGLGRAFLERAETECRQLGLPTLKLTTHVGMPENARLYEHFGWHEIGRSGTKVHMEKALGQTSGLN